MTDIISNKRNKLKGNPEKATDMRLKIVIIYGWWDQGKIVDILYHIIYIEEQSIVKYEK